MTALRIDGLTFSVQPHFWTPTLDILRGVCLSVEPGEIFGFLGQVLSFWDVFGPLGAYYRCGAYYL